MLHGIPCRFRNAVIGSRTSTFGNDMLVDPLLDYRDHFACKWHEARLQSSQSPSKLRLDGEKKPAPSHIWLGHSLSSPSSLALARSEASMPVSLVQNEVRGDVTFCHHPVFSQVFGGRFSRTYFA